MGNHGAFPGPTAGTGDLQAKYFRESMRLRRELDNALYELSLSPWARLKRWVRGKLG